MRISRLAGRTGLATFACLTLRYSTVLLCVSATCTAPPPMIAQPAAQADNFARAIRTDMIVSLFVLLGQYPVGKRRSRLEFNKRRERLTEQWQLPLFANEDAENALVFGDNAEAVPKRDCRADHL